MKESLIEHDLLNQIDIYFANYIGELATTDNEPLWLLAAMVSYFSNNGDSAFSLARVNGKTVQDIFAVEQNYKAYDGDKAFFLSTIDSLDEHELLGYDCVIGSPGEMKPLIFDAGLFYLNRFYQYEVTVAEFIKRRLDDYRVLTEMKSELNQRLPDNFIKGTAIVNWQKVAAVLALRSKFAVISGGPGTGKTTTVGIILALLLKQNPLLIIKMVAPTGKAADRLNESIKNFKQANQAKIPTEILAAIPETAETIHRFIGINSHKLKYDKYRPAPIDLLVIDEASMVSLPNFAKTFAALPQHCQVILLGDKDQLMAVENGNVLKDITDSEVLNSFSARFASVVAELTDNRLKLPIIQASTGIEDVAVQLEYSWRFKDSSGIGMLSAAVNAVDENSDKQLLLELFEQYNDIHLQPIEARDKIKAFISEFTKEHLQDYKLALDGDNVRQMLAALAKFRILCAVNSGPFGVDEINQLIEQVFFGKQTSVNSFYHGRPIIITANDYKLKLMNGDVGIIIAKPKGEFKACFLSDGEVNEFNPASLGEHKTAFVISIHKSQGSEFDNVFIILPEEPNRILTKELIYTAITRAKQQCTIISSPDIFYQTALTRIQRQSGLKQKLAKKGNITHFAWEQV